MIICPKCSTSFVPSWQKKNKELTAEESNISQYMKNDKIDWDYYFENWNKNQWLGTAMPLTSMNIQIIAILETENGRILKILGRDYIYIFRILEICPQCNAILRPKLNAVFLIPILFILFGVGFAILYSNKLGVWFSPLIFALILAGAGGYIFGLLPRKYEVIENSDEGLLSLKNWYWENRNLCIQQIEFRNSWVSIFNY